MKFTCRQNDLARTLNIIQRITTSKAVLPILNGALFEVTGDTCYLQATDLEMGINMQLPVDAIEPGSVVLPARVLAEMVRSFPDVDVTIEVDENLQASISCTSSYLEITGQPADQFPQLDEGVTSVCYQLEPPLLQKMARQLGVALGHEDTRSVFSGILWEDPGEGNVSWVATDMYRLAWWNQELAREGEGALSVVIPGRAIQEVARLAADQENPVQIRIGNTIAIFNLATTTVSCRMLGGRYPDYTQVIPKTFTTYLHVDRSELLGTLERAALVAKEEENKARVHLVYLGLTPGMVEVSSQASHLGRFQDTIQVELEGPPGSVIFNVRYLLDGVRIFEGEKLLIKFTADFGHAVITAPDEKIAYLVVPVKLN